MGQKTISFSLFFTFTLVILYTYLNSSTTEKNKSEKRQLFTIYTFTLDGSFIKNV